MKKIILSAAAACIAVLTTIGHAQAQNSKPIFGIKAGVDLMTLGSLNQNGVSVNYDYRAGFQGGLYADVSISNQVSFMPQLLYTQKGGNINTTLTNAGTSLKIIEHVQLNYFDVPLLFAFKPHTNLNLYVGPQVGFFLSQKSTATITDGTNTANDSNTSSDGVRKVVIGGNLGIGYNLAKNAGLDLNYIFDLQHVASQNDTGEKNSGFVLSVRYAF